MARKKKKIGFKGQLLVVALFLGAFVFLPTTIMLVVGMLPTFVAGIVDKTKEKVKALTVGFMNFAGCFPFWLEMVTTSHTREVAVGFISQPMTLVIMYSAAAMGYMIEWAVTGIVSNVMVQKGERRLDYIDKRFEELERKWGREVVGDFQLDEDGFPLKR